MADGRLVHVPAVGSAAQQLGLDLTRLTIAQWLTWSRASSAGRDTPSRKPVKDWLDKGLKGRADTTVEIVRGSGRR